MGPMLLNYPERNNTHTTCKFNSFWKLWGSYFFHFERQAWLLRQKNCRQKQRRQNNFQLFHNQFVFRIYIIIQPMTTHITTTYNPVLQPNTTHYHFLQLLTTLY